MAEPLTINQAIDELKKAPTAYIVDGLERLDRFGGWLDGMSPRSNLREGSYTGRVMTVQFAPKQFRGDARFNLYGVIRERSDETILLIAGGRQDAFLIGDNVSTAARVAGFEAVLLDGGARDSADLRDVGIGVFTSAIEGRHASDLEIVGYNLPVMFRGEWVQPGDIVAADNDGAVVIPAEIAPELVEHVAAIAELEREQRKAILDEDPIDVLVDILRRKGHLG